MSVHGYRFSNLTPEQIEEIKKIENDINQNSDKEVILLAFDKD
ncbi:MAG: hypothetical protein PWQ96_1574 [Clostridia bacterium]|jgi:hypothetical protein|nr:hypothetical protein [Clostridiales bacterium]MDK2985931.1 hypothetical protein [Clostridia bacterium]